METTTDLEVIRTNPKRYTWGRVVKIHDIGVYTFVEYERAGETSFGIYVDGRCLSYSAGTLERAMVLAISRKFNPEVNTARHMAYAAYRVLNLGDDLDASEVDANLPGIPDVHQRYQAV